jgi:hypothetical protein
MGTPKCLSDRFSFSLSLATIGMTTAVLSALGLFADRRFGAALGRRFARSRAGLAGRAHEPKF